MKPIRSLERPPSGLSEFIETVGQGATWEEFRSHRKGLTYQDLLRNLTTVQHGLCGYCEINLKYGDRQVEHVIPQSDLYQGKNRVLDIGNMIACCQSGTVKFRFGPDGLNDPERFLSPINENMSCGQEKGRQIDQGMIDPRMLPPMNQIMRVSLSGRLKPDKDGCLLAQISEKEVRRTIELLGLNVPRLRLARQKKWQALNEVLWEFFDDPEAMQDAARTELLPSEDGSLRKFFTTARSYFAEWGEAILEQHPREWI